LATQAACSHTHIGTLWSFLVDVVTPLPRALEARARNGSSAQRTPSGDEVAALLCNDWFRGLPETLRTAIVGCARVVRVAAGTRFAHRGQVEGDWVGVICGAVRLSAILADGREFTMGFLSPGHWFGDTAAADPGGAHVGMVAHMTSTLAVVDHRAMRHLMETNADFRDALLQLNYRRLGTIYRRLEERYSLTLPQRLACQVRRLAYQFGRPVGVGVSIELMVSQSDLASMTGCSRQRVNRALRQMQQMGILQLGTRRLLVLDTARLDAVIDGVTTLTAPIK
jgi:CRP/FNR family transcriptional regulator, cyclic AMP receptor protein